MDLTDLLSELRTNMLHDVSAQVGGSIDYLWSDTTLIRYIDQAQRRFARRSMCIMDSVTPQCCQFKTVLAPTPPVVNEGVPAQALTGTIVSLYTLDPSVIAIRSIRMAGDTADLARAGHSAFDTYRMPDTYFFDPASLSSPPPGKPQAFSTDETILQDNYGSQMGMQLRLYPAVGPGYQGITGNMRVIRLPLNRLTSKNMQAIPEIPEDHHLDMLDWAAYLALRMPDLDVAGDNALDRAEKFAKSFEQHVLDVKKEVMRKLFTPMLWGFGRNGWSYQENSNG